MTVGTSMTGRGGHLSFSLSLRERGGVRGKEKDDGAGR